MGAPAVRADRRRGPRRSRAARPRRHRRQGQRRLPPARPARPPGRHRPRHPRRHRQAAHRGRGGVRLAALRRAARASARDRLACDVVVVSDTGMAAPDVPSAVVADARPRRRRAHPARTGDRPALRLLRRRRPQPAARDGDAARRPARRAGPGHPARLLRRGPPAVRPRARADGAGAVRREGVAGRSRRLPGRHRRGRVQHPGADRRPARPPRSTACGAATPAPATRRSSRPRRTPSSPSGWSPTSGPRTSARSCAPGSTANLPGGHRGRRAHPARRRLAVRQRPRLAGDGRAAAPPSPRPGTATPATCCTSARAAAARRPTWSRCSARPLVFLGAGLPTDRIHSPNERVLLSMLHRGAEAAAHLWRELATLPRDRR